jgi:hypothetical protein
MWVDYPNLNFGLGAQSPFALSSFIPSDFCQSFPIPIWAAKFPAIIDEMGKLVIWLITGRKK